MHDIPNISDAEWQVMQVLWESAPRTANEVAGELEAATSWSPRTVKTLLNRLVKKRAIDFEQDGRQYRYFPVVAEADCVRAERQSFLRRVYGGALTPMLAEFIEDVDLSPEEIADLRAILDKKRRAR